VLNDEDENSGNLFAGTIKRVDNYEDCAICQDKMISGRKL
jgi:hypothetical protein